MPIGAKLKKETIWEEGRAVRGQYGRPSKGGVHLLQIRRRSLLVQAPHQCLAHPCHAQHTEAPAFQLVQDYARRIVDVVLATAKRPEWQHEGTQTKLLYKSSIC